jgi:hypothetical protein
MERLTYEGVKATKNPKFVLFNLLQPLEITPKYKFVSKEGPSYNPRDVYQVSFNGLKASGSGHSRMQAQDAAAKSMLFKLVNSTRMLREFCQNNRWPTPIFADVGNTWNPLTQRSIYTVSCTVLLHCEIGTGNTVESAHRQAAIGMWKKLIRHPRQLPENSQPPGPEKEAEVQQKSNLFEIRQPPGPKKTQKDPEIEQIYEIADSPPTPPVSIEVERENEKSGHTNEVQTQKLPEVVDILGPIYDSPTEVLVEVNQRSEPGNSESMETHTFEKTASNSEYLCARKSTSNFAIRKSPDVDCQRLEEKLISSHKSEKIEDVSKVKKKIPRIQLKAARKSTFGFRIEKISDTFEEKSTKENEESEGTIEISDDESGTESKNATNPALLCARKQTFNVGVKNKSANLWAKKSTFGVATKKSPTSSQKSESSEYEPITDSEKEDKVPRIVTMAARKSTFCFKIVQKSVISEDESSTGSESEVENPIQSQVDSIPEFADEKLQQQNVKKPDEANVDCQRIEEKLISSHKSEITGEEPMIVSDNEEEIPRIASIVGREEENPIKPQIDSVPDKKSPEIAEQNLEQQNPKKPDAADKPVQVPGPISGISGPDGAQKSANTRKKTSSVPEKKQPARTCKKASDGKPQKKSAAKEGRAKEERGRPKDSSKG